MISLKKNPMTVCWFHSTRVHVIVIIIIIIIILINPQTAYFRDGERVDLSDLQYWGTCSRACASPRLSLHAHAHPRASGIPCVNVPTLQTAPLMSWPKRQLCRCPTPMLAPASTCQRRWPCSRACASPRLSLHAHAHPRASGMPCVNVPMLQAAPLMSCRKLA